MGIMRAPLGDHLLHLQARGLWQAAGAKLFSDPEPRLKKEYANYIADNTSPERCGMVQHAPFWFANAQQQHPLLEEGMSQPHSRQYVA